MNHIEVEKVFSIIDLFACCAAAPDPSQEYNLFSCVGCEVLSVQLYRADRQDSTELMARNWFRHSTRPVLYCYNSEAFSSLLWNGWLSKIMSFMISP